MNNKNLLKFSLILSLAGILLLLLLSNFINPEPIEIKSLNEQKINQKIQVQGKISYMKNYDTFKILTISDQTGKINILLNQKTNLNLTLNQTIKVFGRLTEYKDKLQITADRIQIN